jgi:hypothetical protein
LIDTMPWHAFEKSFFYFPPHLLYYPKEQRGNDRGLLEMPVQETHHAIGLCIKNKLSTRCGWLHKRLT